MSNLKPPTWGMPQAKITPDPLSLPVHVLGHSHSGMGMPSPLRKKRTCGIHLWFERSPRTEKPSLEKNHDQKLVSFAPQML